MKFNSMILSTLILSGCAVVPLTHSPRALANAPIQWGPTPSKNCSVMDLPQWGETPPVPIAQLEGKDVPPSKQIDILVDYIAALRSYTGKIKTEVSESYYRHLLSCGQ